MTTPCTRALVSLVATMTVTLTAGGCVRGPSRPALDGRASLAGHPLTIRFDNEARQHVHVYLVGEQREWLLGRVEPGARATLRIPAASLARNAEFVQLAVLAGERLTATARTANATFTIAQPASSILAQRWTFVQGQLTPLQLW